MKLTTISALLLAGAAGMGLWSCSADNLGVNEPDNGPALGETVRLTVTVSRDASAATRTALTENDGNLACVWSENDGNVVERILVTDANGVRKGVLALAEGAGTLRGTFTGTLTGVTAGDNGKVRLNFLYLGTALNDKVSADQPFDYWNSDNTYSAYYASQPGALASLTNQDLLTASKEVTLISGEGEENSVYLENLEMKRRISFAKFKLNMPEGVVLGENPKITVSGEAVNTCAKVSFAPDATTDEGYIVTTYDTSVPATKGFVTGGSGAVGSGNDDPDVTGSSSTSTSGTLPFSSSGVTVPMLSDGSLYMVLLPNATAKGKELTFSVTADDEKTYTGTFTISNEKGIEEGKYYHKAAPAEGGTSIDTDAIEINMSNPDAGNKPEQPEEPIVDTEVVGPEFEINVYDEDQKKFVNKKVRFTRANLHYETANGGRWYIPEKQTDFVGVSGRGVGFDVLYTAKPVLDLFRWGATGYDDGTIRVIKPGTQKINIHPQNPYYCVNLEGRLLPYKEGGTNGAVGTLRKVTANSEGVITSSSRYCDWGYVLGLQNKSKDIYFTLTNEEWSGLFDTYFNCTATVKNDEGKEVKGFLMLPCTSTSEAKKLLEGVDKNNGKHAAWLTKGEIAQGNITWTLLQIEKYDDLQKLNAVFFPAAGHHIIDQTNDYKDDCYYWTATEAGSNANFFIARTSSNPKFNYGFNIGKTGGEGKMTGSSVRLVKVVETTD